MSTPGNVVQKASYILLLCLLTLRPTFPWPVEDTVWRSQLVNSSSLCTDPAIEDLNPEDPAILQFSRKPEQQKASFLQHMHSLLGRSLDLDGRPQVSQAAAERLLEYRLLLSESMLAQGLSNLGDSRRMERFLWKLLNGEAVTMVALGGSITAGQGVTVPADGYIARLYAWVQATFPHEGHRLLNKALPGTTSSYISPCALQMVPLEADLVLLEFTFNDAERAATAHSADDPTRRGFERLIRKMLGLPRRPAVVYFHVWTPRRMGFAFYDSPENIIEMVPEYYGLPSLSMRNAMYKMVADFTVPADWLWRSDVNHANCLGNRYMADLLIGYLQDVGLHVLALMSGSSGKQPLHKAAILAQPLPQPMFAHNWETHASRCATDADFQALVSKAQGWIWVNEGKSPLRPKWGFVTEQPGDSLIVTVPTEGFLPVEGEAQDDAPLTLGVSCLMSYEHTGAVALACENGCTCKPREYSLRHWNHVSQVYWKPLLEVELWNSSRACAVRVTNPLRDSNDTKLKVSGVMLTREDFMVSIFDYNKDAEAAEAAEKAAAATPDPGAKQGATVERTLSDSSAASDIGCRRGQQEAVTAGRDGSTGGGCSSWVGGWQVAAPGWVLAAVLACALVVAKRDGLKGLVRLQPHLKRRLMFLDMGCAHAGR